MSEKRTVNIHGKEYETVASRVDRFHEEHKGHRILTEIVSAEQNVIMKAMVCNENGEIIATGHAEEVRGSTNINKTSALENCETSAIGRALASFGLAGTEFASADEVADAIAQQKEQEMQEKYIKYCKELVRLAPSILAIKECINDGELYKAGECWFELSEEEQKVLWVAPTKGGPFTTKERDIIKNDLRKAYYGEAA